ncbi:ribosome maturation factor [Treponema ruminis]|uniref:Ribosome maturation factor RimP n=1 Tax=Treponema ruminis TaxID=744515 RepID=A0A7W8G7Y0_9SPIR|nr:ribosome maturation factor [Treponema ruminis]MBB5225480.1 ribosome maturation factor RimP [Treponema ruminis]QSI01650.1 ribosome maturation factor [Treponema ruminis]
MDYIALDSYPHYTECEKIVSELGFHLVELKISPQNGVTQILATITGADASVNIGVNDCSRVHKVLLPALEEMLGTDNTYMELTSPGMERNIRNAAEFPLFLGREIRVYDKTVTDWVGGLLKAADTNSLTLEETKEDGTLESKVISFDNIAKAKFIHL